MLYCQTVKLKIGKKFNRLVWSVHNFLQIVAHNLRNVNMILNVKELTSEQNMAFR